MYGLIAWFTLLSLLSWCDYYVLRGRIGACRLLTLSFIAVAAIASPLLVPASWQEVRFVLAMVTFNKIIKSLEIAYGRVKDPAMLASYGRYLFWSSNFPDTTWPQTQEIAAINRREGGSRMARALPKLGLVVGLLALSTAMPELHRCYALTILWLGALGYLAFSGLGDMLVGSLMAASGVHFIDLFDRPFISRTPREFWGKRWNIYFRDVCHRNIFLPLGGKNRPLIAVAAVFAASALLHEYLILMSAGTHMLGWMTAFFVLQYVMTIAQTFCYHKLGRKELLPRPLAIACTLLWLLVTSPLLMEPMLQVFPLTTWRLW